MAQQYVSHQYVVQKVPKKFWKQWFCRVIKYSPQLLINYMSPLLQQHLAIFLPSVTHAGRGWLVPSSYVYPIPLLPWSHYVKNHVHVDLNHYHHDQRSHLLCLYKAKWQKSHFWIYLLSLIVKGWWAKSQHVGVRWMGLPHSLKTNRDRLIEDNLGWGSPVYRTPYTVILLTILSLSTIACSNQTHNFTFYHCFSFA